MIFLIAEKTSENVLVWLGRSTEVHTLFIYYSRTYWFYKAIALLRIPFAPIKSNFRTSTCPYVCWLSITWSRDNEDEKNGDKFNTRMQLFAIWLAKKGQKTNRQRRRKVALENMLLWFIKILTRCHGLRDSNKTNTIEKNILLYYFPNYRRHVRISVCINYSRWTYNRPRVTRWPLPAVIKRAFDCLSSKWATFPHKKRFSATEQRAFVNAWRKTVITFMYFSSERETTLSKCLLNPNKG